MYVWRRLCDLVLQISWVSQDYRVQEEDGAVQVCVRLNGTYAAPGPIPTFSIVLTGITAREGTGGFLHVMSS